MADCQNYDWDIKIGGSGGSTPSAGLLDPNTLSEDEQELYDRYCILKNLKSYIEAPIHIFKDNFYTHYLTRDLNIIRMNKSEDYRDIINWLFGGKTPDPNKYPDHITCQSNLEMYADEVVPLFQEIFEPLWAIMDVNSTNDAETYMAILQNLTINLKNILSADITLLNYYVFMTDFERWNYDRERLHCQWPLPIFWHEISPMEERFGEMYTSLAETQAMFHTEYAVLTWDVGRLHGYYRDFFEPIINATRKYINGDVTKKELAEVLVAPETSRTIAGLSLINSDIISATKGLKGETKRFVDGLLEFYKDINTKRFPVITNYNENNFMFLAKFMKW